MTTNIGYWERILQTPTPAYQELFETEKEYLINHIPEDASVLDVGCGDGTTINSILSVTTNITGIDNDPTAVADAHSKLESADVKIILTDALALPFPNQTFDVVIHMMTLVNFKEDKSAALKEMARVCKADGKIVVSVYSEDAFPERMKMYEQIGVPIESVEGTKIIFDKSVGANESEQFSHDEFATLADKVQLRINDAKKVGSLAYIFELAKL